MFRFVYKYSDSVMELLSCCTSPPTGFLSGPSVVLSLVKDWPYCRFELDLVHVRAGKRGTAMIDIRVETTKSKQVDQRASEVMLSLKLDDVNMKMDKSKYTFLNLSIERA